MQIAFTDIKVEKDEADYYHINIQTPETGILIGYHGEALRSLELVIKLIMYRQEKHQPKIILNVGDYREKREEALKAMAERLIDKLQGTGGQPVMFPYLSPGERRVIHIYLKDNPEVETASEGEGDNRRLILRLKKQ